MPFNSYYKNIHEKESSMLMNKALGSVLNDILGGSRICSYK